VLLGQTTTPEFGWKGMTDSPLTGITRNPWDLDRTPGGSSGGAGASLAAGVGALAFGTDGGGSIRIPASYCGLVGLKPSFGRVPQHPVDSPYVTLVAGGPLARTVPDAALMLNVLARPDSRDWYSLPDDGRDWRAGLDDGVGGLRIGVSTDLGGAHTDAEVSAAVEAAVGWLDDAGAVVEVVGPVFEPLRPQFEAYWKAGFAARLRTIPEDRHHLLDPGFRALATAGLDVGLVEYGAAVGARARLAARVRAFHEHHDLLVTPTMPTLPPTVETVYHSPGFDRWEHAVPFTVPFNLTGQPAGSMPCGLSSDGLPIGVQLVATHHREDLVLRAMRAVEAASGFSAVAGARGWGTASAPAR
jgi:aspartyl-tRNA(Asn)/glutamyl-tRNA(Gln) amidotransferase subunit A